MIHTDSLLTHVGLLLVAMALLSKGAAWTVDSALAVARRFKVSDVVIGATVIALGTSAPEIVVTLLAALKGAPDISVGNVVGSNIFNVGVILGGCAIFWSIPTNRAIVVRDAGALLVASILLCLVLYDRHLARWEGLVMMGLLASYLVYMVRRGDPMHDLEVAEAEVEPARIRHFALLALGLAAVLGGAQLLVDSASTLAGQLGLSEWAIGVTVVAAGTSLPELATAIVSARGGHTGVMAGVLIGSDIFNVLGVLGLAGALHPLETHPAAVDSVLMMTGMVAMLVIFMRSGWQLTRAEGGLLVLLAVLRWGLDLSVRAS